MIHELKTYEVFLIHIARGIKSFEVRKDDRNFKVGDTLILKGILLEDFCYTGNEIEVEVMYKLTGEEWGIMNGYCILGIKVINYNF